MPIGVVLIVAYDYITAMRKFEDEQLRTIHDLSTARKMGHTFLADAIKVCALQSCLSNCRTGQHETLFS